MKLIDAYLTKDETYFLVVNGEVTRLERKILTSPLSVFGSPVITQVAIGVEYVVTFRVFYEADADRMDSIYGERNSFELYYAYMPDGEKASILIRHKDILSFECERIHGLRTAYIFSIRASSLQIKKHENLELASVNELGIPGLTHAE